MFIGSLILVSLSLGLSKFAAAIGIGLSGVDARTRIKTGLAYGFFEAMMPILGLLLGQSFCLVNHLPDVSGKSGATLVQLSLS